MGDKVRDGAEFFQTQAVYEPEVFARFMDQAKQFGKPVIAGFVVLKSGNMARRLNETLPGVFVPQGMIEELDAVEDKSAKSIEIGGRVIAAVKGMCQGVHVMAIGWESRVPAMLEAAGISKRG